VKLKYNENGKVSEIHWTKEEFNIVLDALAIMITEEKIELHRIKAATLLLKHYLPGWRNLLKDDLLVKDRNDPRVREWKKAVFKRDEYKCVKCGEIENLQAHHIIHWADYYKGRVDINNGITLCSRCHAKEHEGEQCEKLIMSRIE
jgi:hypothetical protein